MKIILIVFLSITCSCLAQDNSAKIIDYLGEDKYDKYQSDNPQYIDQLNSKINNGYSIQLMEDKKLATFPVLDQIIHFSGEDKNETIISIEDFIAAYELDSFNILLYKLTGDRQSHLYYRLGTTNYVLTIYSMEHILSKI